jgi:Tropinone reductase 1
VKKAESLFGDSIDCLVNNVGTYIRMGSVEYEPADFEKIMNTNLVSAFRLSQLFYPLLKKSGRGSLVNIGSVAGQSYINMFLSTVSVKMATLINILIKLEFFC